MVPRTSQADSDLLLVLTARDLRSLLARAIGHHSHRIISLCLAVDSHRTGQLGNGSTWVIACRQNSLVYRAAIPLCLFVAGVRFHQDITRSVHYGHYLRSRGCSIPFLAGICNVGLWKSGAISSVRTANRYRSADVVPGCSGSDSGLVVSLHGISLPELGSADALFGYSVQHFYSARASGSRLRAMVATVFASLPLPRAQPGCD